MGSIKSITGSRLIVTLEEAKAHLRVTHTDDDTYITALIKSAATMIESFTNRLWHYATVQEVYKYGELSTDTLTLGKAPALEVTAVITSDGTTDTTISAADYQVDIYQIPGAVVFDPVPTISMNLLYPVQINYKAGLLDATEIPAPVKSAALLIIGHLYENRQDVIVGRIATEMPKASEYLLTPYIKMMV